MAKRLGQSKQASTHTLEQIRFHVSLSLSLSVSPSVLIRCSSAVVAGVSLSRSFLPSLPLSTYPASGQVMNYVCACLHACACERGREASRIHTRGHSKEAENEKKKRKGERKSFRSSQAALATPTDFPDEEGATVKREREDRLLLQKSSEDVAKDLV